METYFSEKRFFEWHKDQKSVTLRNKGASYGGERSFSLLPLSEKRKGWKPLCHRLQMGATRTSYAREVNSMQEEILIAAIYPETTPKVHIVQDKTRQDKSFTIRAREFRQVQVVVIARKGKQDDISENNR